MLRWLVRAVPVVATAAMIGFGLADPVAAGPFDPDDPCAVDPTSVECQDGLGQDPPGNDDTGGPDGGNDCGPHNGVPVPCVDEILGWWVGTPNIIYGYETSPDSPGLVGCWARLMSEQGPRPQPEWDFPIKDDDPDGFGRWYRLSCLGPDGLWPDDVVVGVAAAWLLTADVQAGPDAEEVAWHALAQIGLATPVLLLSPPASGSVALGMPLWLAVSDTDAIFGPISDTYCEQGLCVSISARVTSVTWAMGDGGETTCAREQNIAWRSGMVFLEPGDACHYYYGAPSRDVDGGRYAVSATTRWRAEWSGGGETGVFEDVVDACGPGGDGLCQSTVGVRVDEIQVLVR